MFEYISSHVNGHILTQYNVTIRAVALYRCVRRYAWYSLLYCLQIVAIFHKVLFTQVFQAMSQN